MVRSRRRTCRCAIIGLVTLIIIMNTGLAGLIPLSGQWSGAAKGMCKTCIQCTNTEGEEQKACLMECLRAGVGYLLGPLCDEVCSFSGGSEGGAKTNSSVGPLCKSLCSECIPCAFEKGDAAKKCVISCVGEALVGNVLCNNVCGKAAEEDWMRNTPRCEKTCKECTMCAFEGSSEEREECALDCVIRNLVLGPLCDKSCENAKNKEECVETCLKIEECAMCVFESDDEAKKTCALMCVANNFVFDAACDKVCQGVNATIGYNKTSTCKQKCLDIARTCPVCGMKNTQEARETCLIRECVGAQIIGPLCNTLFMGDMVSKCMECGACAAEPEENRKACLKDCVGKEGETIDICRDDTCRPICNGQRTDACRQECGSGALADNCTDSCIQKCMTECTVLCQQCGRCGYEPNREAIRACTTLYCVRPFMMQPVCEDYCSESGTGGLRTDDCVNDCINCEDCIMQVDCVTRKEQVRPCLVQCMFRDMCEESCEKNYNTGQDTERCRRNCQRCKHCAGDDPEEMTSCLTGCFNSLSVLEECNVTCISWGLPEGGESHTRCTTLCAACTRCDVLEEPEKGACLKECTMAQMEDYHGDVCDGLCQDHTNVTRCRQKCMGCTRCVFQSGGENLTSCILSQCVDPGVLANSICEEVCAGEEGREDCIDACVRCPGCMDGDTRRKRLDCFTQCTAEPMFAVECNTICQDRPGVDGCYDTCKGCVLCLDDTGPRRRGCLERCVDRETRRGRCDVFCGTALDAGSCLSACLTCDKCDHLDGANLQECIHDCTQVITVQMHWDMCDDMCASFPDPERCAGVCSGCTQCLGQDNQYECLEECVDASDSGLDFSNKEQEREIELEKELLSGVCDLLFGNIWDMFSCNMVCALGGPCPITEMRYLLKCPEIAQDNLYVYYTDLITYFENVAAFYENMEKALDAILMGTVGLCGMCNYMLTMLQVTYTPCVSVWNPGPYGAATPYWNEMICDQAMMSTCFGWPGFCPPTWLQGLVKFADRCPLCQVADCVGFQSICKCGYVPCPEWGDSQQAFAYPKAMDTCHEVVHEADDACTMEGLWWRKVVDDQGERNPCHVIGKIMELKNYVHVLRTEIIPDTINQIRALRANARRCTIRVSCASNIRIYLDLLEVIWDRANHIDGWDTRKFEDETNKFTLAMQDFLGDIGSGGMGISLGKGGNIMGNVRGGLTVTASAYLDITAGGNYEKYLVWVPKYQDMQCGGGGKGDKGKDSDKNTGQEAGDGAKKEVPKTSAMDVVKDTFGVRQIQAMINYQKKLIQQSKNKKSPAGDSNGQTGCTSSGGMYSSCIPSFPTDMYMVEGDNLGEDLVFNFPLFPKCGVQAFGTAMPGDAFWHYHECLLYRSHTPGMTMEGLFEEEMGDEEDIWDEEEEVWGEEEEESYEEKIDCTGLADLTPCYDDEGICCDEGCVPGATDCISEEDTCSQEEDGSTCMDGVGLCCMGTCFPNATACSTTSDECLGERDKNTCSTGLCCKQRCIPNAIACGGTTVDCLGKNDGESCADGRGICCNEGCIPGALSCAIKAECSSGFDGEECADGLCCDGYCVPDARSCGVFSSECSSAGDLDPCMTNGLCCRGTCILGATSCGSRPWTPHPDELSGACGKRCDEEYSSPHYCHPMEGVCACMTPSGPRLIEDVACSPRVSRDVLEGMKQCCTAQGMEEVDVCFSKESETGYCCFGAFSEHPIDLDCVKGAPLVSVSTLSWQAEGRTIVALEVDREVNLTVILRNEGSDLRSGELSFVVKSMGERVVERTIEDVSVAAASVGRFHVPVLLEDRLVGAVLEARAVLTYQDTVEISDPVHLFVLPNDAVEVVDGYFESDGERDIFLFPGDRVSGEMKLVSSLDEEVNAKIELWIIMDGSIEEITHTTEYVDLGPGTTVTLGTKPYFLEEDDVGVMTGILVHVEDDGGRNLLHKQLVGSILPDAELVVFPPYLDLGIISWSNENDDLVERAFEGTSLKAAVEVVNPMPIGFSGDVTVSVLDKDGNVIVTGTQWTELTENERAVIVTDPFTTTLAQVYTRGNDGEAITTREDNHYHVIVKAASMLLTWLELEDRVTVLESPALEEGAVVDVIATSEFEDCGLEVRCEGCTSNCEITIKDCMPVLNLCKCRTCRHFKR